MQVGLLVLLLGLTARSLSADVLVGHPEAGYSGLRSALAAQTSCNDFQTIQSCEADPSCAWSHFGCVSKHPACLVHSGPGLEQLNPANCSSLTLLGVLPPPGLLDSLRCPALALLGSMDGVTRTSHLAVARERIGGERLRFGLIDGATHHSFADPGVSIVPDDLRPSLPHSQVHELTAAVVAGFGHGRDPTALEHAERRAAMVAAPLVQALKLEGSTMLGQPACNSDFPTNPTCQYPKWPDHALFPGPAPAPSPLPPSDCVCGSPWVAETANRIISGLSESAKPSFTQTAKDAFHDVSDTHPFHLPHIFNSCDQAASSCQLNMTTLTMPVHQDSPLFPNSSSGPLSVFELRSKIKSREAVWEAAGLGPQDSKKTDQNMTMCRAVNQAAYDWALEHADPAVRAQFEKDGEPLVMVDDKPATIGITGPEWIKDELVYTRTSSAVEVQSWQFVVGNTNQGKVPWFFPVGMHYCKLLSPARAMEWIYTDGLRRARG